jgi:FdhD protein
MLSFRQIREVSMHRINNGSEVSEDKDFLAAEEPLEIRIEGRSVAVVMRTPGDDHELAAGFSVTEGLVHTADDISNITHHAHCLLPKHQSRHASATNLPSARRNGFVGLGSGLDIPDGNIIDVHLRNPESVDLKKLTRHVFTSSSCGICSKATIQAVQQQFPVIRDECVVEPEVLLGLPHTLGLAQETFKRTGGLHACALFHLTGKLIVMREDIGRHNALDKVIGWALLEGRLPLREHVLLLSGRTSFEMLQKALAAGVPIVAAISAPSSLAVQFAHDCNQTLIGFLRGERMNIYAGAARVRTSSIYART